MPPSPPVQHNRHLWQHTVLLAGDSKNTVLAEMAGPLNCMAYSPYGQQSSRQEVIAHLGFNGELLEAKTDWYFLGQGYRVYNPWLMRFHSPDKFSPFGKGWFNAYMYCGGEPVMRADPTGEAWFDVFANFWRIFSPVGPGGGHASRTATEISSVGNDGILGAFIAARNNSQVSFNTPSRSSPLNRSHRKQRAYPIGSGSSTTTNVQGGSTTISATDPTPSKIPSASLSDDGSRRSSSSSIWNSGFQRRFDVLKGTTATMSTRSGPSSRNSSAPSTPSSVRTVSPYNSGSSGYESSTGNSTTSMRDIENRHQNLRKS